ncbi:TPA: proteasome assembly chaperone family protein [Candidatus Woesearchaeota archaeon]|nr:proteasome assembly chaperone family protein [Candidatus Woesearchaeota archaeon]
MEIVLKKKPKSPTIIEGFPGFGLIGTITTEFLIDQLKAECIGYIKFDEIPTMIAIHEGKVVNPIGLFYDKDANLLMVHVVTSVAGIEWKLASAIVDIAKQLNAKEIVSLEGLASQIPSEETHCFFYTSNSASLAKFKKMKIEQLKEGIIVGVSGALLLEENIPVSCVFAETNSGLPDSKAAAEIIKVLDNYFGLKLDPKPLIDQAEKFEKKIQTIIEQGQVAKDVQQKKSLSYVG